MTILVAYSSKYGATQQIAERIAEVLAASGVHPEARAMKTVEDASAYEAFVLGSAVYIGSWMSDARAFVRRHRDVLAARPVWLFSSGPLGTEATDAEGHDVRDAAQPKQLAEMQQMLQPRDHHVFFGASDHTRFTLGDRLIHALPAGKKLLPDGDFRDWSDVEQWAEQIAHALSPTAV
jgi:menaquinone-dependent protoporphyrinogen oxidase